MSERVTKAIHYAILTIIAIIFVLPLVWLILAAFDLNASQALKWPSQWTFSNFTSVLTNTDNLRGFGVGLTISLIQSLIVVLVSGLAAYPLSKKEFVGRKVFNIIFLITMFFVPEHRTSRQHPGSNPVSDSFRTSIWNLADEELYGWRSGRTGRSGMGRRSYYYAVYQKDCSTTDVPWNLCSVYLHILRKLGQLLYPIYSAEF